MRSFQTSVAEVLFDIKQLWLSILVANPIIFSEGQDIDVSSLLEYPESDETSTTLDYESTTFLSSTTSLETTIITTKETTTTAILENISTTASEESYQQFELTVGKLFPCTCYDFHVRALKKVCFY